MFFKFIPAFLEEEEMDGACDTNGGEEERV
jgi:hypothetical protein